MTIMQEMEERHRILKGKWKRLNNMQVGEYLVKPSKADMLKFVLHVNQSMCEVSDAMTKIESEMLKDERIKAKE